MSRCKTLAAREEEKKATMTGVFLNERGGKMKAPLSLWWIALVWNLVSMSALSPTLAVAKKKKNLRQRCTKFLWAVDTNSEMMDWSRRRWKTSRQEVRRTEGRSANAWLPTRSSVAHCCCELLLFVQCSTVQPKWPDEKVGTMYVAQLCKTDGLFQGYAIVAIR